VLGAGWSSNSKYSLLGALRGVAQTISYEVSIILILLGVVLGFSVFDFTHIHINRSCLFFLRLSPFLVF